MIAWRPCAPAALSAAVLAASLAFAVAAEPAAGPRSKAGSQDFAHQIDIGGRKVFLVCRGTADAARPTVILVSGYHNSSDPWVRPDVLSLLPQAVGPPVLPGLARRNRVCAYDRPGTLRYITGFPLTRRSTPVPQPRTARDLVTELHSLLAAGGVQPPYVLVGHSLGGLVVLLYASTYPSQVRGIVFVDALSSTFRAALGPLWPLYLNRMLNPPAADQPIPALREPGSERIDIDASIEQVQHAPPLPRMPIAVLTKTKPFRVPPASLPPGLTLSQIDTAFESAEDAFVALEPATPHVFATGSEHYIQLSQPDLVISATELVIARAVGASR